VDEQGVTAGADLVTALLAPVFLRRFPGTAIVYELRSSWAVKEEIQKAGGVPVRDRVGHSFMKATMRQKGAMFGGELSGHFYFAENFTADSGMIAMMSVLSLLSAPENKGKTFQPARREGARYHRRASQLPRRGQGRRDRGANAPTRGGKAEDELDGIAVEFGELGRANGGGSTCALNTEPFLRMIVEASSPELRDEKKAELIGLLGTPE
jgi:phosphomannomutase